jgi:hypothetical protein
MKMAKWIAVVVVLGVVMVPWTVARAQDQPTAPAAASAPVVPEAERATDEQLNRLFEVMRIKQQMASATQMMPQLMKQQFDQSFKEMEKEMEKDHPEMASMTDEQRQAAAKVMEKFMSKAMTLYTSDEMIADMRELYGKHLTAADIDATVAFYSSPAGQHFLDMVPAIMQEFLPTVMQKVQAKMRPLIVEMSKEMAEIASKPADKPEQK